MHATNTNYITIEPRIMPRGPLDAAVGLGVGAFQFLVMIVVALIPACVVQSLWQNSRAGILTFLMVVTLLLFTPHLFVVWRLRCDAEGLEFVRLLGKPGKIPWADVESIEEASQAELVLQGWLWPRFPLREMTLSITSIGHYRISWAGGAAYFPPRDVQRFLYAIHIGRGYAAGQQHPQGADPRSGR